ncbi:MAG: DUF2442 domain-containing protein [Sterolibacterium sp.]
MNKVVAVRAESEGRVFVEMADGRRGLFDVRPYLRSEFFRELESETYFRQVRIFFSGIGWPNGQDLGPDTIAADLVEMSALAA